MAALALVLTGLALALTVLLWQIERHRGVLVQCGQCTAELWVRPDRVGYLIHMPDDSHVYVPKEGTW